MSERTVAYTRDASFFVSPNTSGPPPRYHFDNGKGMAVCNSRTLLLNVVDGGAYADEVPVKARCTRRPCAVRWHCIKPRRPA